MLSVQILSDTTFAAQAAQAVDGLVQTSGCGVRRAQISGLRQIAVNQPGRLKEFAQRQKQRAEKRRDNASRSVQERMQKEIDFWMLVISLCDGQPPRWAWSLQQEAVGALPLDLRIEPLPKGAKLGKEEQAERATRKKRQHEWLVAWRDAHYPAFFQRFCAHYLYRLGKHDP